MAKKETRGRPKVLTKKQREKNDQAARERWRKANTKIVNIRFRLDEDKEVLDKLATVPNKADYIRNLILKDIKQGEQPCFSCYNRLMKWKTWVILNIVALVLFFGFWALMLVNYNFYWGANIVFALWILLWIIIGVNQYSNSKK